MGRKPLYKNIKSGKFKGRQHDNFDNESQTYPKEKKIQKAPRVKDTILSDIELQIIDLFGRSYSNGEIGVKYPQQKKKGMMRLMNFCFRTIIEQVAEAISPSLRKQGLSSKCVERKEKTIFHLSSNYRYKHIQKSLLEDFKKLCRNYFKFKCFQHMDTKFLENFYNKVIYNDFTVDPEQAIEPPVQVVEQLPKVYKKAPSVKGPSVRGPYKTKSAQKLRPKSMPKPEKKRKPRGKYNKQPKTATKRQQAPLQIKVKESIQEDDDINEQSLQSVSVQLDADPANSKICISKVNIYFGNNGRDKREKFKFPEDDEDSESERVERNFWTFDMESALIEQFQSSNCRQTNMIVRNMMKKFGRNKLFVEKEIKQKWTDMFYVSVKKFIYAFDGKLICKPITVKQIEVTLREMSIDPENFFIARFIHDFYFKEIDSISITLLAQYLNKLKGPEKSEKSYKSYEAKIPVQHNAKETEWKDREKVKNAINEFLENYSVNLNL